LGLIVPETKFINLFVNGARHGVYWQVEQWGPEFLARNNIATSTNLYGSAEFADLEGLSGGGFSTISAWRKYASKPDGIDDYRDLQRLLDVINLPSDEAFNEQIGTVIDFDNFYAWQINQYLTMSDHQSGINLRLYPDPTTGRFRFLPWDIMMGDLWPPYVEANYNQLITRILSNGAFLHERNLRLWQYIGDEATLADDLAYYDALDAQTRGDFFKDSLKTESHLAYREKVALIREQLIERVHALQANLQYATAQVTVALMQNDRQINATISTDGFSAVTLEQVRIQSDDGCANALQLLVDQNVNGTLDAADRLLGAFSCDGDRYVATPNLLLYSIKDISDHQWLSPGRNQQSLLITARQGLPAADSATFVFRNAVTGAAVSPDVN